MITITTCPSCGSKLRDMTPVEYNNALEEAVNAHLQNPKNLKNQEFFTWLCVGSLDGLICSKGCGFSL